MRTLTVILLALLCSCESATKKVKEDFMPLARGEADEIILVIDSTNWNGQVGDQLKEMYRNYIVGLPQDEYQFKINQVSPRKLNSVLRNVKNLIFVMTLDAKGLEAKAMREYFTDNSLKMIRDDSSLFYTAKKDEFAKGQIALYLYGQDSESLTKNLKENSDNLVSLFESAVTRRMRDAILKKTKPETEKIISQGHEYQIAVPFGYDLAKNLKDFIWLRKLEADAEWNVFVHSRPYTDREVFNYVDELRDDITSTYLRDSEKQKLHIDRQKIIPVITKRITFKGKFAVEARGLWKVSDNSAGGPFISYTLVDEATNTLYYLEGYVYAPGGKKKPLIREVEAILATFETKSASAE